MVNFLLVGNGAREHAIAESVCKNPECRLFAYTSAHNPGIAALANASGGAYRVGDINSPSQVAAFANEHAVELAFPSPDAVLAAGVTDALITAGIACAAPTTEAARLEWDKAYARELLRDFRIPGSPKFGIFDSASEAASFIDFLGGEAAVKPAGLTGGKGVKVVGFQLKDSSEAKQYAKELLSTRHGGLNTIIIEEKLEGEEFSLQAFSDGDSIYGMPMVQDHKRAGEGDVGQNTGGMGSYSDAGFLLPFTRQEHYDSALDIMKKTIEAFKKKTGRKFVGVLYGGFMATAQGVRLLEYNSRFGDPEALNVLAVMETDLLSVFSQMAKGRIKSAPLFSKKASVCKYAVPEGYPTKSVPPSPIQIDHRKISSLGAKLYFASVNEDEGIIYTQSSRSIALVGVADTVTEAERIAESACGSVMGRLWHRRDIGTPALVQRRIDHMKALGVV